MFVLPVTLSNATLLGVDMVGMVDQNNDSNAINGDGEGPQQSKHKVYSFLLHGGQQLCIHICLKTVVLTHLS